MTKNHYHEARAAFGRAAVVIADAHGHDAASQTMRGAIHGFLLAYAEMNGWDVALHEIHQIAAAARVPVEVTRPRLKVHVGGRAA